MQSQKILVTGSSGFLGQPLAAILAAEGRAVVGLDVVAPDAEAGFEAVVGDVAEPQRVHRLFREHGFGAVVHCGGISGPMLLTDDPHEVVRINVFGTAHLLEAARIHGVRRFVFCSSLSAYGENVSGPVSEDAPFRPMEAYGASKAAGDVMVRAYRIQYGLDGVSFRIGRVYGPVRRTTSVIGTMVEDAVAGRTARLAPSGGNRYQYVYRDDIVAALKAALDAEALPETAYNVSGPGEYTVEEVADIVRAMVPEADIRFDGSVADGAYRREPLDTTAIERDLGWKATFDLRRGIAAYVDWARDALGS